MLGGCLRLRNGGFGCFKHGRGSKLCGRAVSGFRKVGSNMSVRHILQMIHHGAAREGR